MARSSSAPSHDRAPARRSRAGSSRAICAIIGGDCERRRRRPDAAASATATRRPVADRPPAPRPAVPGLGHGHVHLRRARPQKCVPQGRQRACRSRPAASSRSSARRRRWTPTAARGRTCRSQTKLKLSANAEAKGAKAGGSLAAYLGQSTKYQLTVAPGLGGRRSPTATARRPTRSTRARSRPARASSSPRTSTRASTQGLLPRAAGRDGLRRGPPRVQRRQADQPDDRAGDGRRHGLRPPGAQARRRLQGRQRSRSATPRTSPTASCTRSTSTSPTRPAGTPTRRSWPPASCPKEGTPGTINPTKAETVVYTDVTRSRPSSAASSSAGSVNELRGPPDRDDQRRRHRRPTRVRPLRRRRRRGHDQEGRRRQRGRHRRRARCCSRTSTSPTRSRASTRQTGKTPPSDTGGNMRLDFTEAQLEQLRQAALARLADKVEMNGDGRPTNDGDRAVAAREPRRRQDRRRRVRLRRHRLTARARPTPPRTR